MNPRIDESKLTIEQLAVLDVLAPKWSGIGGRRLPIFNWAHEETKTPSDDEMVTLTDEILKRLRRADLVRRFGDDTIVVTLDGQVVIDHGQEVDGRLATGILFVYKCASVEAAIRVHAAWDMWTDARIRLTKRSSVQDRERVKFLYREFRRLEAELGDQS